MREPNCFNFRNNFYLFQFVMCREFNSIKTCYVGFFDVERISISILLEVILSPIKEFEFKTTLQYRFRNTVV